MKIGWVALTSPIRQHFEFLSGERWQNFLIVRAVVDWIFKFVTWNIIVATVYAIYAKTHSAIIFVLWLLLTYLLIAFVLKLFECIVRPRQYDELSQLGLIGVPLYAVCMLALYAAFWAIDYNLVTGLSSAMVAFQAGKQ